ncbi:hypothetical protein CB1_001172009 [Camelus ferus]|nr:hypothetical protein CB1_001172009 [Camelus ferus]
MSDQEKGPDAQNAVDASGERKTINIPVPSEKVPESDQTRDSESEPGPSAGGQERGAELHSDQSISNLELNDVEQLMEDGTSTEQGSYSPRDYGDSLTKSANAVQSAKQYTEDPLTLLEKIKAGKESLKTSTKDASATVKIVLLPVGQKIIMPFKIDTILKYLQDHFSSLLGVPPYVLQLRSSGQPHCSSDAQFLACLRGATRTQCFYVWCALYRNILSFLSSQPPPPKTSTEFSVSSTSHRIYRCRHCINLDNETRKRESFLKYKCLLQRLYYSEADYEDDSKIAFLMQLEDIQYLTENIWASQSALSARNDLNDLVMVRWDKSLEWSPWNCILLTKDEGATHLKLQSMEEGYEPLFIHKIKHKHFLAKNYFSQIPLLAAFLLDDGEVDEIRKNHQTDTTPKIIEIQRPSP